MVDKKSGWSLDIPRDPNKTASYSSPYVLKASSGQYVSKEAILKAAPRRINASQARQVKPKK